jgi:hypothetical protein
LTKKRPSDNPLIVHISEEGMLSSLTDCIPDEVQGPQTTTHSSGKEVDGKILARSSDDFV